MYRYLGMKFYHRTRLCINLGVLCCEKLGYRQDAEPNELRRKVLPAISQLEGRRVYGLSHEFSASYGKCDVVFNALATTKNAVKSGAKKHEPVNPLPIAIQTIGTAYNGFNITRRSWLGCGYGIRFSWSR